MQTVTIDCRFAGGHTGLGRYTRCLVRELVRHSGNLRYVLLAPDSAEEWLRSLPAGTWDTQRIALPSYSLREHVTLPPLLRRSGAALHFSPHFTVPWRCPLPFVATIHDLILHRYPNRRSLLAQAAYRMLLKHTVQCAASLIAVSKFVGDELTSVYGEDLRLRITVVPEGVDTEFHPRSNTEQKEILARHGLRRPFFLYVGNAKEHKNVPLLLTAFTQSGRTDCTLALVTGGREAAALRLPPRAVLLQGVPDADLPALYSAATACVTASLYEGFCLPVAEALACGCPVLATRRAAIPELARDGVILLEPDAASFAAAMRSPPLHAAPMRTGTWENAAVRTASVFRSCLSIRRS
ncbi:MAG: AprM [Candidatus Peregrinibacteria bacterium Gr01-1014_25]|nr:MAG: AprM [Candidatus Peregrinibacteria bacterium Gr01-1014_25]